MAKYGRKKIELRMDGHDRYLDALADAGTGPRPNVVLILCDDLGYGDIGCYGSKAVKTPNIDRMAQSGARFDNFYAGSPLCTPSRFSVLTGRYPNRNFIRGVFFPTRKGSNPLMAFFGNRYAAKHGVSGILPDEITLAEVLQRRGYRTGIFGKWHLGDRSPHLPNEKGFDYFFGTYYSNDMVPYAYYRNTEQAIAAPADQTKLTGILTNEITSFIRENKDNPFFVYYPSPFPHFPVHASEQFQGKSDAGAYGDCVEEVDWSVGEIIKTLEECGLSENTLVLFTSDNGPWFEGSPGYHRGRKGNNFDGGQAVPLIARRPGTIPEGLTVEAMSMNIDFFPTVLEMTGTEPPSDRTIDGRSILPLLTGERTQTPHENLLFVGPQNIFGIRDAENFKYVIKEKCENSKYKYVRQGPFLFNLNLDRNESYDVSAHAPQKRNEMAGLLEKKQLEADKNPRGWLNEREG